MTDFAIAVKAFIVDGNKLLLLKRNSDNSHKPGEWDIPGGRLELGEDPSTGVKREALEETGLEIKVIIPLDAHSFTRDDGQSITMLIFLCAVVNNNHSIALSGEHTEYTWQDITSPINNFPEWLHRSLENFSSLTKY